MSMEKIKLVFGVLGALSGITGAYATSRPVNKSLYNGPIYNWYIITGDLAFRSTIEVAKSACPFGFDLFCLRGTAEELFLPPITLLKKA